MDDDILLEVIRDHIREVTSQVSLRWVASQARLTDTPPEMLVNEGLAVESIAEEIVHQMIHGLLDGLSAAVVDDNGVATLNVKVDWTNAIIDRLRAETAEAEAESLAKAANDTAEEGDNAA